MTENSSADAAHSRQAGFVRCCLKEMVGEVLENGLEAELDDELGYSKCFDRHTNIKDAEFICFGVKELIGINKRLKDTLLFNILRQSVICREVDTILSGCH